jgi:hypothetical protein
MASDPERLLDLASSAENRALTVLFCDLRDFTPMAEQLAPERLRELPNLYFPGMSQIVHAHGSALDEFIGDAVMAFRGAPPAVPRHAARAVPAALAMGEAVAPLPDPAPRTGAEGAVIAAEIASFHEQLGFWRLARAALRGHHGSVARMAPEPSAQAVARARLAELLKTRPATPALHALATRLLAKLAAHPEPPRDTPPSPSA